MLSFNPRFRIGKGKPLDRPEVLKFGRAVVAAGFRGCPTIQKNAIFGKKWGIKNGYLASVRSLKTILGRKKFFLFLNQDLSDSF